MTESPPSELGAVQVSDTSPTPSIGSTAVGADGVVKGTIADDADEYDPSPAALDATTRNLYEVPFVRPVTVCEVELD